MFKTLEELIQIIGSYSVARMLERDDFKKRFKSNKNISIKEFQELLEAIKIGKNQTHEAADLVYHLLVLLECNDIKIEEVMAELQKRQKQSGLEEKARTIDNELRQR